MFSTVTLLYVFSLLIILPVNHVFCSPTTKFDFQWMEYSSCHYPSRLLRSLDSSYPQHWYRHSSGGASALGISLFNLFQAMSSRFGHTQCYNDRGEEGRKRKEVVGSVCRLRNEHWRDKCDDIIRELHLLALATANTLRFFSYIPNWHSEQDSMRCSWSF